MSGGYRLDKIRSFLWIIEQVVQAEDVVRLGIENDLVSLGFEHEASPKFTKATGVVAAQPSFAAKKG